MADDSVGLSAYFMSEFIGVEAVEVFMALGAIGDEGAEERSFELSEESHVSLRSYS